MSAIKDTNISFSCSDSIESLFDASSKDNINPNAPKDSKLDKLENYNSSTVLQRNLKSRVKKNRKRSHHGEFIIMEAEVDDEVDDGEEVEEVTNEEDIIQDINEIETARNRIDIYGYSRQLWSFKNDTEIEEYFRIKYSCESIFDEKYEYDDDRISPAVQQNSFLPDIKDPNLWMVECRIGEEKSAAIHLMRKYLTYINTNEPLYIKSVVVPEGNNGFIYIESYKQSHIKRAIENIKDLRKGLLKLKMLDLKEKTGIFKYTKPQRDFKTNQLVRVKSGLYKNDLGQLNYVDVAHKKVNVKLLPRIDYTKGELKKKGKRNRPPSKPLDLNAIRSIGGNIQTRGDHIVYNGNRYSHDGYLFKTFSISTIASDGIIPTITELETYHIKIENLNNAGSLLKKIVTGDNVKVCKGDLENLMGVVSSVNGDMVTIIPNHKDLKDPIVVKYCDLEKYFRVGDHVSVVTGLYKGEKGFVVRVEPKHIVLISDLGNNELEVLINDVQLSANIPFGNDHEYTNKFQFGDFVQLNSYNVGVIVRLNKEYAYILNVDGKVIECKQSGLQNRISNEKITTALDVDENSIGCKSFVRVLKGPHAGLTAEVKYLYRNYAFLHSSMCTENGGIFVSKTYHLQLGVNCQFDPNGFHNPKRLGVESPYKNTSRSASSKIQREKLNVNSMLGKTILICKGMYKGSVGIVKFNDERIARVELHSSCQTISVNLNHITIFDKPKKIGNTFSNAYQEQTPVYIPTAANTPLIDNFVSFVDSEDKYLFNNCSTKYY